MHYVPESVHRNTGKHALDDRAVCTESSVSTAWVSNSAKGVQSNGSTSSSGSSAACSVAVCTELLAVVVDAPQPASNDVDNSIAVVIAVNCFTFSYLSAMIFPPVCERTFVFLFHY